MLPMLLWSPVVVVLMFVAESWAACDTKMIEAIRASWGGHPPCDITVQLAGRNTYLYQPPFMYNYTGLLCFQTDYIGLFKAEDRYLYTNLSNNWISTYELVEEEPGIVSLFDEYGGPDGHMYAIYLSDGVFACYQCTPDCEDAYTGCTYDPFVVVSVLDYHRMTPEKELAIKEAHEKIKEVGLEVGPKIGTVCPTMKG